ncbi:hypothetical protein V6N13_085550 [Hibiscus sabdariffa]|uniref:Uncharacterized protein n=2 Tax=Hibiscus sabdariffa TaxID=183260 RepID=A0ABR2D1X2_9ROSI
MSETLSETFHSNRNRKAEVSTTLVGKGFDPRSDEWNVHDIAHVLDALTYVFWGPSVVLCHSIELFKAAATTIRRSRFEFDRIRYAWIEVIRHSRAITQLSGDNMSDNQEENNDASNKTRHCCFRGLKDKNEDRLHNVGL